MRALKRIDKCFVCLLLLLLVAMSTPAAAEGWAVDAGLALGFFIVMAYAIARMTARRPWTK
jgi:hypothetical protein